MIHRQDDIRRHIDSGGKMRPEYIKHEGVLTDSDIQDIPLEKVYEWVRTGKWKQRDFKRWCKALRITGE